jgi:hypothetical protein
MIPINLGLENKLISKNLIAALAPLPRVLGRYREARKSPDAARIAAIRHRSGKSSAHPELALRLPQQQQTGIRGLVAALKIHCEFLASDRWQVEGKRCSVDHDGCGARLIRDAIRLNTDLLRESLASRHSRHINLIPRA